MAKIKIKRGMKKDIPLLDNGEFALAMDENELFIGNNQKNCQIPILNEGCTLGVEYGGTSSNNIQEILYKFGCKSRENLIINSNFKVNQRGKKHYSGIGYTIDMWKIYNSGSINIEDDGIRLNNITDFAQLLEINVIKTPCFLTASIITADGNLGSLTKEFTNTSEENVLYGKLGDTGITLNLRYNWFNKIFFGLQGTGKIRACKLEIGENQTLAWKDKSGIWNLYENPNYHQELFKCQRYLQFYTNDVLRPKKAVDCRPQMRIDPTQMIIQTDENTYYANSAEL